jgi:hypothetical protein
MKTSHRSMTIRHPAWAGLLLVAVGFGCSASSEPAGDAALPTPDREIPDAAPAADAAPTPDATPAIDAAPATTSVPFTIAAYPGGAGKFLLASITVNGSSPIDVMLDTGSAGLHVFAAALGHTTVTTMPEPTKTEFGGEVFFGHKASGTVSIGPVTAPSPVVFDLVESISCVPGNPYCDPASAGKYFADSGIYGILGIGLRNDPSDIYSPLAQLGAPLSDGFTLRTGGFASQAGELVLGAKEIPGGTLITLKQIGTLPGGLAAWADDEIQICYKVDGVATNPPCSDAVLDTGSNLDVLYAKNLPASAVTTDGLLASGVSFEASHASGFQLQFTVGTPITWSLDGVLVQQDEAFTILGIEVFFRHDVAFDLVNGQIGLLPHS